MLKEVFFLQSYGFPQGSAFGNLLAQWEALGVFSYVLPFLLIFALVFVTLSNIGLFKQNRGVNAIIALATSLMALQYNFVSLFFAELFPRFGIALAIILILVIVGGFMFDAESPGFRWLFAIIGLVIVAIVIFKSLYYFGWYVGDTTWINIYWPNVLLGVLIVAGIIWVIAGGSKSPIRPPGVPPVYRG